jgi:hypothetical protein
MTSITTRHLTHKLTYDTRTDHWSCKCGYVLGTGHRALYAKCQFNDDGYIEFDISTPTYEKKATKAATPKRQIGRRVARIHRKGQDLFQ